MCCYPQLFEVIGLLVVHDYLTTCSSCLFDTEIYLYEAFLVASEVVKLRPTYRNLLVVVARDPRQWLLVEDLVMLHFADWAGECITITIYMNSHHTPYYYNYGELLRLFKVLSAGGGP